MSKPVNLNQARKAKARAEMRAKGDANAAKFGRTKAQKDLEQSERAKAVQMLDRHKRDPE